MAIRDPAYARIDVLLIASTPSRMAIGSLVIGMARNDDGHKVCIGDGSAANLCKARAGLQDAPLHDVKWTLKLIQPILIQMVQDFWDTRTAILTGVPVPGTRPRIRRQRFRAVAEGDHGSTAEAQQSGGLPLPLRGSGLYR